MEGNVHVRAGTDYDWFVRLGAVVAQRNRLRVCGPDRSWSKSLRLQVTGRGIKLGRFPFYLLFLFLAWNGLVTDGVMSTCWRRHFASLYSDWKHGRVSMAELFWLGGFP